MEHKPGGSSVGKYPTVKAAEFAGPKGGAPKGSYPINSLKRAKAAVSDMHIMPQIQKALNALSIKNILSSQSAAKVP